MIGMLRAAQQNTDNDQSYANQQGPSNASTPFLFASLAKTAQPELTETKDHANLGA